MTSLAQHNRHRTDAALLVGSANNSVSRSFLAGARHFKEDGALVKVPTGGRLLQLDLRARRMWRLISSAGSIRGARPATCQWEAQ